MVASKPLTRRSLWRTGSARHRGAASQPGTPPRPDPDRPARSRPLSPPHDERDRITAAIRVSCRPPRALKRRADHRARPGGWSPPQRPDSAPSGPEESVLRARQAARRHSRRGSTAQGNHHEAEEDDRGHQRGTGHSEPISRPSCGFSTSSPQRTWSCALNSRCQPPRSSRSARATDSRYRRRARYTCPAAT